LPLRFSAVGSSVFGDCVPQRTVVQVGQALAIRIVSREASVCWWRLSIFAVFGSHELANHLDSV